MTENKIDNKIELRILEKIKHDNLKPKSIWYFLIKDYSLWLLVFISIILAALSIAPIIFIIQNLEPELAKHISSNIYLFILNILPYPWILLCILTTYFAAKAWENTKHGYKFDGKKVFAASFLASLVLGIILNLWNFGRQIDDDFHQMSFGNYKSFEERRDQNWFDPANGRLVGVVQNVSTSSFTFYNDTNSFTQEIFYDQTVPGLEFIDAGNKIRVIGYVGTDTDMNADNMDDFIACAIFPDALLPGKMRNSGESMRNKMEQRFQNHPECKSIFEEGRANFHGLK